MDKRRLVVVLIAAVSLLGLRTSYACEHVGKAAQPTCCCKGSAARCPKPGKCAGASAECCSTALSFGTLAEPAAKSQQPDKLDVPMASAAIAGPSVSTHAFGAFAGTPFLQFVGSGSLTWLRTSRLRL